LKAQAFHRVQVPGTDVECGGPALPLKERRQRTDGVTDAIVDGNRKQTGSGFALLAPIYKLRQRYDLRRLNRFDKLQKPRLLNIVKRQHKPT